MVYQVEGGKVLTTEDKIVDIWVNADSYQVENVETKTFTGYKQKATFPAITADREGKRKSSSPL